MHPQDQNRFKAALRKAEKAYSDKKKSGRWKSGCTVPYECDYRVLPYSHKDANHHDKYPEDYLWVRAVGRVTEDESGTAFLSGGHSNISDEIARHEAFELWEYIFKRIIHADPNMIYIKRDNHDFVFVNDAVAEFYGTTREAIIDHSDEEFSLTAEQRTICWSDDDKILKGIDFDGAQIWPQTIQRDELLRDFEGRPRWFRTVKKSIMIGGERHVLGISTDITDAVMVRDELQTIIDQVPIPIHTKTKELRYDRVNKSFVELVSRIKGQKLEVADIEGKTAAEIYGSRLKDFSKSIEEIDVECIDQGKHSEFKVLPYREGGSTPFQFIRIAREKGGLLGVTIDVTEQERLSEIKNMEALTSVFRTLSHSLLDVVTEGVKKNLKDVTNDDSQLDSMLNALNFLQSYTFRLKILETTLDQGFNEHSEELPGYKLNRESVKLAKLVESAKGIITNFCPEIPIFNDVDHNLEIVCDHNLLQMVLIELLHNSMKYTCGKLPDSPVQVSAESNNGVVRISVIDSGAGPAPDVDTKDWFEAFARFTPPGFETEADDIYASRPDGTGFGLFFAKLIVASHGGRFFDPIANKDQGTKVTFQLPRTGGEA